MLATLIFAPDMTIAAATVKVLVTALIAPAAACYVLSLVAIRVTRRFREDW